MLFFTNQLMTSSLFKMLLLCTCKSIRRCRCSWLIVDLKAVLTTVSELKDLFLVAVVTGKMRKKSRYTRRGGKIIGTIRAYPVQSMIDQQYASIWLANVYILILRLLQNLIWTSREFKLISSKEWFTQNAGVKEKRIWTLAWCSVKLSRSWVIHVSLNGRITACL